LRRKNHQPAVVSYPPELALAGHAALALLNTVSLEAGIERDVFERDDDVWRWLERLGVSRGPMGSFAPGSRVRTARALREVIRTCVVQRKSGKRVNLDPLNSFLAETCGHSLVLREGNSYRVDRVWSGSDVKSLLAPIADAAAHLLAMEDFTLVRRCESHECILWFFDTTKGHGRRWCSMATCGNRAKAAAFRARSAMGIRRRKPTDV
jgi:predicted RNA-binding Zn ribbon-like protein